MERNGKCIKKNEELFIDGKLLSVDHFSEGPSCVCPSEDAKKSHFLSDSCMYYVGVLLMDHIQMMNVRSSRKTDKLIHQSDFT